MSAKHRVADAGLFLIHPTPTNPKQTKRLYARVNAVTVYSAPQPTKARVVVYRVACWLESPVEALEGNEHWYYTVDGSEESSYFSFEATNESWPLESIESDCILHFLTYVVPNKIKNPITPYVERLYRTQEEGKYWEIYTQEQPTLAIPVTRLRHYEVYACDGRAPLKNTANLVEVAVAGGEIQTLDAIPYHADSDWVDVACKQIVSPNTYTRRVAKKKRL